VENLLSRVESMGLKPGQLIRELATVDGQNQWKKALNGFKHRLYVSDDFHALSRLVHFSWLKHGSIGAHLLAHREEGDPNFSNALDGMLSEWKGWIKSEKIKTGKGFGHLIPSPSDGSSCKRWCMYLRWMVRHDALDLGLWSEGSKLLGGRSAFGTEHLVMPLDVHTGRISQYLGLTSRKSLNWLAALEVTENLRKFESSDPVKYDFALARLGILDICKNEYRVEICEKCELRPACRFANLGQKKAEKKARIQMIKKQKILDGNLG